MRNRITNLDKWTVLKECVQGDLDAYLYANYPNVKNEYYYALNTKVIKYDVVSFTIKDMPVFYKNKPTNNDIYKLKEFYENIVPNVENVFVKVRDDVSKTNRSVLLSELCNSSMFFTTFEEAEKKHLELKKEWEDKQEFVRNNSKPIGYDYNGNGYKFLGWMNSWGKDYPSEYLQCRAAEHIRLEVSHNNRGSENTCHCPICKIYWKYDCSD